MDHTRSDLAGACTAWEVCFVLRSQKRVSTAFAADWHASLPNPALPEAITTSAGLDKTKAQTKIKTFTCK